MTIEYGNDGSVVVTRDGQTISPNMLNPVPQDQDKSTLVDFYKRFGAVIYSTQWVGWVPVPDCGTTGDLPSSQFKVTNLRINGTLVNGLVSVTISGLDTSQQYQVGVRVRHGLRPFHNVVYPPLSQASPSGYVPPGDKEDSAAAIVLAIILPFTAILIAVAVYFYVRNRRLEQELSVELPDVTNVSSTTGQSRYKSRRGDQGTFSRAGQDYSNSLLGDDEETVV